MKRGEEVESERIKTPENVVIPMGRQNDGKVDPRTRNEHGYNPCEGERFESAQKLH